MRGLWLLLLLPLSCLELPTSTADDAGAAGSSGTGASGDAAAAVTGSDCVTDSASRITLCSSVSICGDLAVDHEVYPNCGFRVAGSVIDLECLCDEYVCPVGTALSCVQARQLLLNSTEAAVCVQAADGRCAARATTGSTPESTCDDTCAESCANSPSCLELCGC